MPPNLPSGKSWEDAKREALNYVGLVRPKPGGKEYVVILEVPRAYETHWVDGRGTLPHCPQNCPHCPRPITDRFYGPVAHYFRRLDDTGHKFTWKRGIVELMPSNMVQIGDELEPGICLELSREAKKRAPLRAVIYKRPEITPSIPAWDVLPNLFKIWGLPMVPPSKAAPEEDGQILKFKTG